MSLIIKNNKEFSVIKVEPYNQQIINIIKEFKDRKFNNESKEFSLPNAEMDLLKSKLENGGFTWNESQVDQEESRISEAILLNYENKMFQILNMPIKNKKLYFFVKDHLIKIDEKVLFSESFYLYFLDLCNKNKISINFK